MTHTRPLRDKKYTADDFKPFIKTSSDWDERQLQLLPNLEPLRAEEFINIIAYHQMPRLTGYIVHAKTNEPYWGTLYLGVLQSGGWDGSGYVAVVGHSANVDDDGPYTARFALCKHKNKYLPIARPERGFHDQFCTLCGLDTSVDSSD